MTGTHIIAAFDSATAGMTQHHQMGYFERGNSIFHGRRRAVVFAIGIIRRDKIGDIAVNEKLALVGAKNGRDMHAAVTA